MVNNMMTVLNVLGALLMGFLAIFMLRIIWPLLDIIFTLWDDGASKVFAQFTFWMVTFIMLYFFVWRGIFESSVKKLVEGSR